MQINATQVTITRCWDQDNHDFDFFFLTIEKIHCKNQGGQSFRSNLIGLDLILKLGLFKRQKKGILNSD